eukprot:CAMPEP_0206547372 /NCGR_PEP_ID=MMETSP0325_2-20121206/13257_1 /ASSEMBLY_ACC=CAM_ASM_000347 /TAXON_ID=2866 /ORGANISM="Crypthecodinium cohnii, Strain Seligo" /LENGTH=406 /DNA_ID=CAMNT_0054046665 /DNA_START=186 /DNA_END=1402 /DNA_ORIENTATION=-
MAPAETSPNPMAHESWRQRWRDLVQCVMTSMFDTTWDLITPENIAQALGALAASTAALISLIHIARHWRYNRSKIRKSTVRLLFVVPIFAITCWSCLMLEDSDYNWAELLNCVREVYEAVALVSFMELMLTILGGSRHLAICLWCRENEKQNEAKIGEKGKNWTPPLFSIVLQHFQAGPELLQFVLLGIFQYVMVCVIYLVLVAFVWGLQQSGCIDDFAAKILTVVINVMKACSCAAALSCLLMFAHQVKDLVPSCGLTWKFLSIKGIVFFTFWQGFVIWVSMRTGQFQKLLHLLTEKSKEHGLDPQLWDESQLRSGLNDFLLCFEVLFFSILHLYAYPAREMERLPEEVRANLCIEEELGIERVLSVVNLMNIKKLHREIFALSDMTMPRPGMGSRWSDASSSLR